MLHLQALGKPVYDRILPLLGHLKLREDLSDAVHHGHLTADVCLRQPRLGKVTEDLQKHLRHIRLGLRHGVLELLGQVLPVLGIDAVHRVLVDNLLQQLHEGVHVPQVHLRAGRGRGQAVGALGEHGAQVLAQEHLAGVLDAEAAARLEDEGDGHLHLLEAGVRHRGGGELHPQALGGVGHQVLLLDHRPQLVAAGERLAQPLEPPELHGDLRP
mmetsp:Transcript_2341/g.6300  ORF Transcript_2341/g.6300 Transcript_2341/m.6300 type:complete len:214 (-) Transcript_2341:1312-1953(-)